MQEKSIQFPDRGLRPTLLDLGSRSRSPVQEWLAKQSNPVDPSPYPYQAELDICMPASVAVGRGTTMESGSTVHRKVGVPNVSALQTATPSAVYELAQSTRQARLRIEKREYKQSKEPPSVFASPDPLPSTTSPYFDRSRAAQKARQDDGRAEMLRAAFAARRTVHSETSFTSQTSYESRSPIDDLLGLRQSDPEEMLLSLGFGGPLTSPSRIPPRFLGPSVVRGVDIRAFLGQERERLETVESGAFGYRGLQGPPHRRPSQIVANIIYRIKEQERLRKKVSFPQQSNAVGITDGWGLLAPRFATSHDEDETQSWKDEFHTERGKIENIPSPVPEDPVIPFPVTPVNAYITNAANETGVILIPLSKTDLPNGSILSTNEAGRCPLESTATSLTNDNCVIAKKAATSPEALSPFFDETKTSSTSSSDEEDASASEKYSEHQKCELTSPSKIPLNEDLCRPTRSLVDVGVATDFPSETKAWESALLWLLSHALKTYRIRGHSTQLSRDPELSALRQEALQALEQAEASLLTLKEAPSLGDSEKLEQTLKQVLLLLEEQERLQERLVDPIWLRDLERRLSQQSVSLALRRQRRRKLRVAKHLRPMKGSNPSLLDTEESEGEEQLEDVEEHDDIVEVINQEDNEDGKRSSSEELPFHVNEVSIYGKDSLCDSNRELSDFEPSVHSSFDSGREVVVKNRRMRWVGRARVVGKLSRWLKTVTENGATPQERRFQF